MTADRDRAAVQAGPEVGNDAKFALIGRALRGDPVEGGESGDDARRRIRAGRKAPCCDHLVADIFVNSAARFGDGEGHVADKAG